MLRLMIASAIRDMTTIMTKEILFSTSKPGWVSLFWHLRFCLFRHGRQHFTHPLSPCLKGAGERKQKRISRSFDVRLFAEERDPAGSY